MKKNKHKFLCLLVICQWAFTFNLHAIESITFIRAGIFDWPGWPDNQSIAASLGKEFTIDWGDGSPVETNVGTGSLEFIRHSYSNSKKYTVTIKGKTEDCLFTKLILRLPKLFSLDVSKCLSLEYLVCSSGELETLNLSKNKKLVYLCCYWNKFTTLNVTNNTNLKYFHCSYNRLNSLDVSKNMALEFLSCDGNYLTGLDVSNKPVLAELYCNNNKLKNLNISGCYALARVDCGENLFSSLDLTSNYNLRDFGCNDNQLSSLDLTKNSKLRWLICSNNQLNNLDLTSNSKLKWLTCSDNQLCNLDLSNNLNLMELLCSNNQLNNIDLGKNTNLWRLDCSYNKLKNLNTCYNTALSLLYCNNNQINSFDLSNNHKLNALECENNNLENLYINHKLNLYCNNNHLKLSNLYVISELIYPYTFCAGTQKLKVQKVGINEEVDFSSQKEFGGILTVFKIEKEGVPAQLSDYSVKGGIFTFHKTGNFTVTMTNQAILSFDDYPAVVIAEITVGNIGIKENTRQSTIKLYPNPVVALLHIETEDNAFPPFVEIFSIQGSLLLSARENQIDVSALPSGIYVANINGVGRKFVKK